MSNTIHTPTHPTTSSLNPFNILAGLVSDTIEIAKSIGSEVSDIPDALADGWNNGTLVATENSDALKAESETVITPAVMDLDAEITRLTKLRDSQSKTI